jgi:antitoxin HicB
VSDGRYPKHLFWSDEDEGFIAVAPDLPGSSAFGETEAEAIAELDRAIDAWIEAARAAGNAIPAPSRPASTDLPSGKVLVRMPKGLHQRAALCAEREDVSLNQFIVSCLAEAVGERSRAVEPGYQILRDSVYPIHPTVGLWSQQQTSPTTPGTVVTYGGRAAAPISTVVAHSGTLVVRSGAIGVRLRAVRKQLDTAEVTSARVKQDQIWRILEVKTGKSHARG